jgi:hypothetical protein
MAQSVGVSGSGRPSQPPWLMIALAISLAFNIALAAIAVTRLGTTRGADASTPSVDSSKWFSVFLNNKEAFVGHITSMSGTDISMSNIYYLTFEADPSIANPKASDFKPQLKKLGQEVWGPQDFVRINRANMEYYTELRSDSPIVKAIAVYQAPTSTATPTPAPKPTPSK